MNKFDWLQQKDVQNLAEFLVDIDCIENQPWTKWFDDKYCNKCESIEMHYPNSFCTFEVAPCEIGECPFGISINDIDPIDIVKMWLESESEE